MIGKCELCGIEFEKKRREQRFCSVTCSNKWVRRTRRTYTGAENPNYGKLHTEEARNKIRKSRIGSTASDETRLKMSMAHKGQPKSSEWRRKISQALTRNPNVNNKALSNPNYKHGKYVDERVYRKLVEITSCESCGETDCVFDVHHIDGDHFNNEMVNLRVLCHSCHGKLHGRPVGVREIKPRARKR